MVWKDVEAVLGPEASLKLKQDAEAELLEPGFREKVTVAMAHGAEVKYEAQALILLGPSASGKSHALKHGSVKVPDGALTLDGGYIRSTSSTWAKTLELAKSHKLAGFANFFNDYFKGPMDKLKKQVVEDAIRKRANLVVPDTASTVKATIEMIDKLLAAGYTLQFLATYADREVCESRGLERESEEGKKFSSKNWIPSVQAILDVQAHILQTGPLVNIKVYNNNAVLHEISHARLEILLERHRKHEHSGQARWCETSLLAGIYSDGSSCQYEVVPANLEEELVAVDFTIIENGAVRDYSALVFDVNNCRLRENGAPAGWSLRLTPEGRASLVPEEGFAGPRLVQTAEITGKSLHHPVHKDSDLLKALKGLDFCQESLAPLSDEEFQHASVLCKASGPEEAPSREKPRALFIVAPSGGGKTTVLHTFAGKFDMKAEAAVLVDSGIFRDVHKQYAALISNGQANQGIWYRAWPAAKDVLMKAKKKIMTSASAEKKDLLISDTGAESSKLVQSIEKMKEQGYVVSVCGIFAEPKEIVTRGTAREVDEGKRFNRDVSKLKKTFDSFAPAVAAANGKYCLVRNSQGRSPELYLEGHGGEDLSFSLEEALASSSFSPPKRAEITLTLTEVSLPPVDLFYIMEGNLNIVCAYRGVNPSWAGCVLRCRKGDNSTYRTDCKFAKGVAAKMLGAEYIDTGDLVALKPENMKAIDDAIFSSRPPKRQDKRLDVKVRDASGQILALKVANLMASPVPGAKVVTVELKPKCGLLERAGLPSRYTLLQYHKLAAGKIDRLSGYDPVKLLSKDARQILESLEGAMTEPQNNIRIFVDGHPIFSEEVIKKAKSSLKLDPALAEAGLPGKDGLLSILSGVLSAPTMLMPDRLKRIQSWAAGETAPLALQLYLALKGRVGEASTTLLSDVASFELAVEDLEQFPCDEAGTTLATRRMDEVLSEIHTTGWTPSLELEAVKWLCRFLLGRTAHDVSVLINFVKLSPEALSPDLDAQLRKQRYLPLDFIGVPGSLQWTGIWYRVSVVDTDAKSPEKISEYATQLDEYVKAYYNRFTPSSSSHQEGDKPQQQEAVGGHDDSIRFEGAAVWKRDQGGHRGLMELIFLKVALEESGCKGIVPAFLGVRIERGEQWLGMENILHGLTDPSILDMKMGTRTWNTDAKPDKVASQATKAAASTTGSLGVRLVGGKIRALDGQFFRVGYKNGKDLTDEAELQAVLSQFLCTEPLRTTALERVKEVQAWWTKQAKFAFYASSLLLTYDSNKKDVCRVGMIDFANCEQITSKEEDLSGYNVGLDTMLRVISGLKPSPAATPPS